MYVYDPRSVLIHFNPNHDKLGRFARSNFGASKTSKPVDKSKTAEYNKSDKIDKEKLKRCVKIGAGIAAASLVVIGGAYLIKSGKLDGLITNGRKITDQTLNQYGSVPVDSISDTGSIKKLSRPETIKECMKNTNPHFEDPAYDGNCTSCSIAAIMRMRGYDAKAGKVRGGAQSLKAIASRCFDFDSQTNFIDGKNAFEFGESPDTASKMLVDKFGKNSAGAVGLVFQLPTGKSFGHAFNFSIKDGVVEFFDTQKPDLNLDDSFIRQNYWPLIAKSSPFEAVRLDNAEPVFDFLSLELET